MKLSEMLCTLTLTAGLLLQAEASGISQQEEAVRPSSVQVYFGKEKSFFEGRLKKQIIKQARAVGLKVESYTLDGPIERQIKTITGNYKPNVPIIIQIPDKEYDDYYTNELIRLELPLIFVLRKPVSDNLNDYADCWFVRSNSIEGGIMLGQSVYDYMQTSPQWDKDKNGILDILLVTGPEGHRDTYDRTKRVLELLRARNVRYKIVKQVAGDFDYEYTMDQLTALCETGIFSDVDVIIAHNDDMALAAVSVLVDYVGYDPHRQEWPGIFGVDGSSDALIQISEGYMTNTVVQDDLTIAKVCVSLAVDHRDLNKFIDEDRAVINDNDIQLPYHLYRQLGKD